MATVGTEMKLPSKATQARSEFARRLREIRVPKGFRTARSLARALGIDENRYTRYERAEVEPDLEMIRHICSVLEITPNDLLGTETSPRTGSRRVKSATNGHAAGKDAGAQTSGLQAGIALDLQTAAWQLAELAAARSSHPTSASPAGAQASPLASIQLTGQLYRKLMEHPFEAIADISNSPEASAAPSGDAIRLRASIDRLVELLREAAHRS